MLTIRDDFPEEYDTLYREIGETLAAWAGVEHSFASLLQRLTGMNQRMASSVFFSARNFNTRADMLRAALRVTDQHREVRAFSQFALKRALQYVAFRNALAHGVPTVVPLEVEESPFRGKGVVFESGDMKLISGSPITPEQMRCARYNFFILNGAIQRVASWNEEDAAISPSKYLALVQELPNPPQSREADPSVLERLALLLAEDWHPLAMIAHRMGTL